MLAELAAGVMTEATRAVAVARARARADNGSKSRSSGSGKSRSGGKSVGSSRVGDFSKCTVADG